MSKGLIALISASTLVAMVVCSEIGSTLGHYAAESIFGDTDNAYTDYSIRDEDLRFGGNSLEFFLDADKRTER
jgi:hypothetical protein